MTKNKRLSLLFHNQIGRGDIADSTITTEYTHCVYPFRLNLYRQKKLSIYAPTHTHTHTYTHAYTYTNLEAQTHILRHCST